ncbi:hypothetical protein XENOCAPTIV_018073 [Xenoophorus captivus]|uniref:Beta/gamma crystallin 'Greek key' domain-containing protein n=1 Tax=Xenoophorus captivus TaxID=1517983 RepID=A0ABV0R9C7_9TELE
MLLIPVQSDRIDHQNGQSKRHSGFCYNISRSIPDQIISETIFFQIIFYEDKNFQGRSYETSSDCAELTSYLSRCNSCRVESGCFMVYERPNFMGHQMLVRRGDGQMKELMDDCDSIQERYRMSDCQSLHVMDGHWLLYEQPSFKGRMLYLRPGEYRSLREMGTGPMDMRIGSIRRIMESC